MLVSISLSVSSESKSHHKRTNQAKWNTYDRESCFCHVNNEEETCNYFLTYYAVDQKHIRAGTILPKIPLSFTRTYVIPSCQITFTFNEESQQTEKKYC